LSRADIRQTAIKQELHCAIDGDADRSRVSINPPVGIQIGIFCGSQFRQTCARFHFQPWLRKFLRSRCRNIGLASGYSRFVRLEVTHHDGDDDENSDAGQQQNKGDGEY
jgi:hypothetical protein